MSDDPLRLLSHSPRTFDDPVSMAQASAPRLSGPNSKGSSTETRPQVAAEIPQQWLEDRLKHFESKVEVALTPEFFRLTPEEAFRGIESALDDLAPLNTTLSIA